MMLPRSLQGRLLLLVLGLISAVWLAAAALTWFDVRHELDELLDGHLAQAAALLVVQQAREIEEDDEHGLDAPILHRYAPKVAFQVLHEGRIVLRSANAPLAAMLQAHNGPQSGFATAQIGGAAWRVFAAHGAERDVQVFVGEEVEARASILWAVMRGTLWPFALALPLLALAAWWAIRRGTAPLRELSTTLAQRQPDALQTIFLRQAPTETQSTLDALNNLFARIRALMESERRFTADAAHELRTPIAAIRAQAQVALGEADDTRRRHALQATLEGCDRAARLVEQLLTLSRLEATTAAFATLDLSAVVRQVAADLAPRALHKAQSLEVRADQPVRIEGDTTLLAVLVRNLLDNAIRYSPPGARVAVSVAGEGAHAHVTVEDSGTGMLAADAARLGERFFRVLGTTESGSGLGWSIVRRIAQAHQASVTAGRSASLDGLAVQVRFPAARQTGATQALRHEQGVLPCA
jgi:two-component system sensor histidine kinase QseC